MDSISTGLWAVGLTVGVALFFWIWVRTKKNGAPESMGVKMKRKIPGLVGRGRAGRLRQRRRAG